jgi:intracellular sulfur oxidation DsrE/DsrF family protein
MRNLLIRFQVLLILPLCLYSQEKKTGPVIKDYGAVWEIPSTDLSVDPTANYSAVFDIMQSPEDPGVLNPWIETAARFLNMHARAGVPKEKLRAVLVVHNRASKDLLADAFYRERFDRANPNTGLLESLMESGVQVVFCGQSSVARQVPKEEILPGVQLSLSAMTALIHFQNAGYRLIKF